MTNTMPDIIDAKLDRAFQTLDADRSGFLEWADYEKLANRYLTAYRLDKNDRRARAIIAFHQMSWLELLRHSGIDGDRLNKQEYITATRLAMIDTSRLNLVEGSAHAIFDVIDVDGDNEISRDEFARFQKDVWQITSPNAIEVFERLDTDGDGAISRQEFIRAIREYHYSTDADTPGSAIFGQI